MKTLEQIYHEQKGIAKYAKWIIISFMHSMNSEEAIDLLTNYPYSKINKEKIRKENRYKWNKTEFNIQKKREDTYIKYKDIIENFLEGSRIEHIEYIYVISHKIAKLIKLIATTMNSNLNIISSAKKYNQKLEYKLKFGQRNGDINAFMYRKKKYKDLRDKLHDFIENNSNLLGPNVYKKYIDCVDRIVKGCIFDT